MSSLKRFLNKLSTKKAIVDIANSIFGADTHFLGDLSKTQEAIDNEVESKTSTLKLMDMIHSDLFLSAMIEEIDKDDENANRLEMLIAVDMWENQDGNAPHEDVSTAMNIYDKCVHCAIQFVRFFSLQAVSPIPISNKMRISLEGKICTESGRPDPDAFAKVKKASIDDLTQNFLPRFRKTAIFRNYFHIHTLLNEEQHSDPPREEIDKAKPNGAKPCVCDEATINAAMGQTGEASSSPPNTPTPATSKPVGRLAAIDSMGRYIPFYDVTLFSQEKTKKESVPSALKRYLAQSPIYEDFAEDAAKSIIHDVQTLVNGNQ